MSDATPDPGFLAYLAAAQRKAMESVVRREQEANSLVHQPVSLIDEAEAITRDAALVSPQQANELELLFLLPSAEV